MKLILFLATLFGAAYLFGNYYAFRPDILRPILVQIDHARENNAQALCNMLSLDATVTVTDNIPRHKFSATDMDRVAGCNYLRQAAPLMLSNNPPQKNGYIRDILQNVQIPEHDFLQREDTVSFTTIEKRREMRDQGTLLSGTATTTLHLRRHWLGGELNCLFDSENKPTCPPDWDNGLEITRLELKRDYQIIPE